MSAVRTDCQCSFGFTRRSADLAEVSGIGENFMVFTNLPPFLKMFETRLMIADLSLPNVAKTSLWKERLVPIDGVLDRCYKWSIEKNPREPCGKVERNQFERVTDQIEDDLLKHHRLFLRPRFGNLPAGFAGSAVDRDARIMDIQKTRNGSANHCTAAEAWHRTEDWIQVVRVRPRAALRRRTGSASFAF
jgi:hypothetical protein